MSATIVTAATGLQMPFDAARFQEDLKYSDASLNPAFAEQASLFAYYGVQHARMLRQEALAKITMGVKEAQLDKAIRDEKIAAGEKVTDKSVEQAIARSPEMIRAQMAHVEARAALALAVTAVEAFKQRRDMLIQAGATDRQEMKGDLSMKGNPGRDQMKADIRKQLQDAAATIPQE